MTLPKWLRIFAPHLVTWDGKGKLRFWTKAAADAEFARHRKGDR